MITNVFIVGPPFCFEINGYVAIFLFEGINSSDPQNGVNNKMSDCQYGFH